MKKIRFLHGLGFTFNTFYVFEHKHLMDYLLKQGNLYVLYRISTTGILSAEKKDIWNFKRLFGEFNSEEAWKIIIFFQHSQSTTTCKLEFLKWNHMQRLIFHCKKVVQNVM